MRKGIIQKTSLVLLVLLALGFQVSAQYEEVIRPQTPEEIALYQKLKVNMEKQAITSQATNGLSNKIKVFSPDGQIIGSFTYNDHKYWLYNEQGQAVVMLDSLLYSNGKVEVSEYRVGYTPDGHPAMLVTRQGQSTFTFDPAKHQLTEKLSVDSPARNVYTYNERGVLTGISSYNRADRIMSKHTIQYNSLGQMAREYYIEYGENSADSITTFYMYDNNNRLTTKQVFQHQAWTVEENAKGQATKQAVHNESGVYDYTYDDKGRLTTEDYKNSVTETKSHRFTYQYYDNGLKSKETQRYGKQEPAVIEYTYTFYKQ